MSCTTMKWAVVETLRDLSKDDFDMFCLRLRDRRGEPRVRRCAVEGKSALEIAELLVSTFTEPKAPQVAVDILRQINCNEEAETLYSKAKACTDKGDPTFCETSTGELETQPSQEALNKAAGRWPLQAARHGGPSVLSEGGDPCNDRLVLSRCMIQFGKYKGQTFKWLLENDLSYTVFVVASHQKVREHTKSQSPLMANKDSFTQYAIAYPKVLNEVRFHRAYERSLQSGQEGEALVGFGAHRSETLQDLYESKVKAKISYVNFLRNKKSTCDPGSKMEVAVRYILKRDQEQTAAATNRPTTRFAPPAAR